MVRLCPKFSRETSFFENSDGPMDQSNRENPMLNTTKKVFLRLKIR